MSTTRSTSVVTEPFPSDVLRFCAEHDLQLHVQDAIRLAEAVWHPVGPMTIELETDPETADEWLAIMVPVAGGVEDVVRRQHEFTRHWVESKPFDIREKVLVLFDVVAP